MFLVDATPSSRSNRPKSGEGAASTLWLPAIFRIAEMRYSPLSTWTRTTGLCLALWAAASTALAQEPAALTFEAAETALLDPADWDKPFPGERSFDALRGLLVRFPGLAEAVHARLAHGEEIASAQLVLTWERQEGAGSERGRHGWGSEKAYADTPGTWSVQAWAVKQPWRAADAALAPTFNSFVGGLGFWERGGARGDGSDRHAALFGPLPLHAGSPEAALDVTAALADPAYGANLGERLRAIEERGFLVHKRELYDLKYLGWDGYDWNVATGYMRIWVAAPKLIVSLRPAAGAAPGPLPPALDFAAFAARLRAEGGHGTPSIAIPADLKTRAARHFARPDGMPDWQWARIGELMTLGNPGHVGGAFSLNPLTGEDDAAYLEMLRKIMRMPPRFWDGWSSMDYITLAVRYGDLLPPGVHDHLRLYWQAWIHPELQSRDELPRMYKEGRPVFDDGVPSFFRGYTHGGGTMNFGHSAVMSVLLAGQWLEAEHPLREAREGLLRLLRGWGVSTGAHQEIGDTYYFGMSLRGAAELARHASDPRDRLAARLHLDLLVHEVVEMVHPALRRITHPQGRGQIEYQVLFQDIPYYLLHTLSRDGVLMHLDAIDPARTGRSPNDWGRVYGIPVLGERPPARAAMLAPWLDTAPAEAIAAIVDRKPMPWRVHARSRNPGERAGWHVSFLDAHYALASRDNGGVSAGVVQWRRNQQRVNHVDDLSTLFLSAGTDGVYRDYPGYFNLLHHDHTIIAVKESDFGRISVDKPAASLHASLLLLAHGHTSAREVWLGDRRVTELGGPKEDLPAGLAEGGWGSYSKQLEGWRAHVAARGRVETVSAGEPIAIRDGNVYIGLIPLLTGTAARDGAVEISYAYPMLILHNRFYDDAEKPITLKQHFAEAHPPTAGFVIEMGDAERHGSFDAFREHLRKARLELRPDTDKPALTHLTYASGGDTLEMGCLASGEPAYRRANGAWPYLPENVLRRSNWAVQGSAGRLDLHGASIRTEPGRPSYLLALPEAGVYVGANLPRPPTVWFGLRQTSDEEEALPDVKHWAMALPGGLRIESAGRIGLARVRAWTKENRLLIEHAFPRDANLEETPDLAPALLVFSADAGLQVFMNGVETPKPEAVAVDGETAWIVPLGDPRPATEKVIARWRASRKALIGSESQE